MSGTKRYIFLVVVFLITCRFSAVFGQSIITTVAGDGTSGSTSDTIVATTANIGNRGIAVDRIGNFYFVENKNNRIRKVDTSGIITTFAGSLTSGFSGDSSLATAALLHLPTDVATDTKGNVYIADNGNYRIRKVNTSGIITTIAGSGVLGFGGDSGLAVNAKFNQPIALTVDAIGNVYVSDLGNYRVRKIDTNGIIRTITGTGVPGYTGDGGPAIAAQVNLPIGLATDKSGNVYFCEQNNYCVRKIDNAGTITTVAGTGFKGYTGDGGPGKSAQLYPAGDMAVDSAGSLYICDCGNNCIRKLDASGIIKTVVGTGVGGYSGDGGPAISAQLLDPFGVTTDSKGNLYISDFHRIRKVTLDTSTSTANIQKADQHILIYPNPASNTATISGSEIINSIAIFSQTGELVFYRSYKTQKATINIGSFAKGEYYVSVFSGRQKFTEKLVVAK